MLATDATCDDVARAFNRSSVPEVFFLVVPLPSYGWTGFLPKGAEIQAWLEKHDPEFSSKVSVSVEGEP